NSLHLSRIATGYIKRYSIRNDGSIAVQSIYGPGYYFPLTGAWKVTLGQNVYDGPEIFHYEAMTPTEVYSIDNKTFYDAAESNPLSYQALFFISGRKTHSNIQRLDNLHLSTSYIRVAHQLLYFAKMYDVKKNGNRVTIDVPLPHQDIADVLSSTREKVS